MSGKLRIGIIGCGDFLRLRAADLLSSRQVEVKLLYSPVNSANAERYAEIFGAKAADSPEAIINDPEIDVVCVCAAVCTERICSGGGESRKADRCHKTVGCGPFRRTGNDRGGGAGGGVVWYDLSQNQ